MDIDSESVAPADVKNDLKFVDPSRLPQSKLSALNAAIITQLATLGNMDSYPEHDASIVKELMEKHVSQLEALCKTAIENGDFSRIMLISQFWKQEEDVTMMVPHALTVKFAFQAPFIGDACILLKKNIEMMYKTSLSEGKEGEEYMNYASIIQSTGSGKSRLVDELAKCVFTIPFNLRTSAETTNGVYPAYPLPDDGVRDLLANWRHIRDHLLTYERYMCFFAALFECIAAELDDVGFNGVSSDHAAVWRNHLAQPKKRNRLYMRVQTQVETSENLRTIEQVRLADPDGAKEIIPPRHSFRTYHMARAQSALGTLAAKIPPGTDGIKILLYFDEAHVLEKLPLEILLRVISDLRGFGLFALLLSTQSKLDYHPPTDLSSWSSSARWAITVNKSHSPITETPFDCFDDKAPVDPKYLTEEILSDVGFMARFGRPLWASLIPAYASRALAQATGKALLASDEDVKIRLDEKYAADAAGEYAKLLYFAATKLLDSESIDEVRERYSQTAQAAILDVRIMLPFAAGRSSAHQREMDLVASHMRTVYSIPSSREYIRSGYPSEPILAEAAARRLYFWQTRDGSSDLAILGDNLKHDLLDQREIGAAVARLLLMRARDRAFLNTYGEESIPFSRSVPVVAFIEALFPKNIAEELLDSYPDNVPQRPGDDSLTLREAFKDALINFTHFAKWGDDSAPTQEAALGAYVRHAAAICRNDAPMADVVIPVRLEKSAEFSPEGMTVLIVQVKLRATPVGGPPGYAILQEEFPKPIFPASADKKRPYITITMDVSATPSPSLRAQTPTRPPKAAGQSAPRLQHRRTIHPRYGIYVCGCSSSVYAVIDEREQSKYKEIIRSGDLLGEHPRQDEESLSGVRRQKQFMLEGVESWHWLASEAGQTREEQAVENKGDAQDIADVFYHIRLPPRVDGEATEDTEDVI